MTIRHSGTSLFGELVRGIQRSWAAEHRDLEGATQAAVGSRALSTGAGRLVAPEEVLQ